MVSQIKIWLDALRKMKKRICRSYCRTLIWSLLWTKIKMSMREKKRRQLLVKKVGTSEHLCNDNNRDKSKALVNLKHYLSFTSNQIVTVSFLIISMRSVPTRRKGRYRRLGILSRQIHPSLHRWAGNKIRSRLLLFRLFKTRDLQRRIRASSVI